MSGGASAELDPLVGLDETTKPLRLKLLRFPRSRALSLLRARHRPEHLDWKTLGPRVEGYQALIAEDVKADTRKLDSFQAFMAGLEGSEKLKTFVEKREGVLAEVAPSYLGQLFFSSNMLNNCELKPNPPWPPRVGTPPPRDAKPPRSLLMKVLRSSIGSVDALLHNASRRSSRRRDRSTFDT